MPSKFEDHGPLAVLVTDALTGLGPIPNGSVQMCVTSPPYWSQRDYGISRPIIWPTIGSKFVCPPDWHEWGDEVVLPMGSGHQGKNGDRATRAFPAQRNAVRQRGCFCQNKSCRAWRGHLGLEPSPDLYIDHLVLVFREVRRVLADNGTLWVNIGDCYSQQSGGNRIHHTTGENSSVSGKGDKAMPRRGRVETSRYLAQVGIKPKDLIGLPWMLAFALRADGWYLRSEIVWAKPNGMPESVTDRPTRSHEKIFLLSKSERYYYDADAIAEPCTCADEAIYDNGENGLAGGVSHAGAGSSTRKFRSGNKRRKPTEETGTLNGVGSSIPWEGTTRNKRDVWRVSPAQYAATHFATYPPELIEPCILAGSKIGDLVLDPFGGTFTTAQVALRHSRRALMIEIKEEYARLGMDRCANSPVGLGI